MKLITPPVLALAIVAGSTQLAHAKMIPTGDDKCPYLEGGICYSEVGKTTGTCGELETTSRGGKSFCKLGPKNNPKPVPAARGNLIIQGIDG